MSNQSAEDRLIARYFAPIAKDPGALGLVDDAAVLVPPADCDLVLKTDPIVASVHFFPDDPPAAIARKALRVNLSDLAAKGARPLGFLLSLALPAEIGDAWLSAFAQGLGADAEHFACPLLGGDTDRTPGLLTVTIAALGAVPRGTMVKRSSAQPGDRVVVTGTVGDSALGVRLRKQPELAASWGVDAAGRAHLVDRYLVPQPRLAIAEIIRRFASAAMDISDGLAGDFAKLCRASGVGGDVDVTRVPLSGAARAALDRDPSAIEPILTGGDDYEILATVPAAQLGAFRAETAARGVIVSEIGAIAAGPGEGRLVGRDGQPLKFARPSFSHF
ncbi:MAG: thiamine-phosphate kinase [Xanthobacteraceae bacterium]|nr:thiamine-phosphate kinase [Xanthobacteraceae bacterium]MBV9629643.1 thiamine-phosphate kinase [Xanthobacteraceae bacterium]